MDLNATHALLVTTSESTKAAREATPIPNHSSALGFGLASAASLMLKDNIF